MRLALGPDVPYRRQLLTESLLLHLPVGFWIAALHLDQPPTRQFLQPRRRRIPASARRAAECCHCPVFHCRDRRRGVMFGLLPALQASRTDLNETLKGGAATVTTTSKFSRTALAALQVAFSLALLVGAGLLARSDAFIQSGAISTCTCLGTAPAVSLIHYPPIRLTHSKKRWFAGSANYRESNPSAC